MKIRALAVVSFTILSFAWFFSMAWRPDQTPEISTVEFIQRLQSEDIESVEVNWNEVYGYASSTEAPDVEERKYKTKKADAVLKAIKDKSVRRHRFRLFTLD